MTLFDLKIYFLLFIIYSFAGWIIDTSDVFIEEKKLVKKKKFFLTFLSKFEIIYI
jgi:uncharacterized membrane protein